MGRSEIHGISVRWWDIFWDLLGNLAEVVRDDGKFFSYDPEMCDHGIISDGGLGPLGSTKWLNEDILEDHGANPINEKTKKIKASDKSVKSCQIQKHPLRYIGHQLKSSTALCWVWMCHCYRPFVEHDDPLKILMIPLEPAKPHGRARTHFWSPHSWLNLWWLDYIGFIYI